MFRNRESLIGVSARKLPVVAVADVVTNDVLVVVGPTAFPVDVMSGTMVLVIPILD